MASPENYGAVPVPPEESGNEAANDASFEQEIKEEGQITEVETQPAANEDAFEQPTPSDAEEVPAETAELAPAEKEEPPLEISMEAFKSIEGFEELSDGQQKLVMENAKQYVLATTKEKALESYRGELKSKDTGFFKRVWLSIAKTGSIRRREKEISNEILSGEGGYGQREVVTEMVKQAQEGPEVIEVDGNLEIQYASLKDFGENLTDQEKQTIQEFNAIASRFSRVPHTWIEEGATSKERKQYEAKKAEYDAARDAMLAIKAEKTDNFDALRAVNDMDFKVTLEQLYQKHPEIGEQLHGVTNARAWWEGTKAIAQTRGGFMAMGFAARTAATGLLAVPAMAIAPLVASALGGYAGRKRAKQDILERDILAKAGVDDESAEARDNFADADSLAEKLNALVKKLAENPNDEKAARSLAARIEFTQGKLSKGLVKFGENADKYKNQYALMHALGEAAVAKVDTDPKSRGKLEARLEQFLNFKEQKLDAARQVYVRTSMKRAATYGLVFGAAGAAAADVMHGVLGGESVIMDELVPKTGDGTLAHAFVPVNGSDEIIRHAAEAGSTSGAGSGVSGGTGGGGIEHVPGGPTSIPFLGNLHEHVQGGHDVVSGDNSWNIIKTQLQDAGVFKHYHLNDAEQTHLISNIEQHLAPHAKEIGISSGDLDKLAPGDHVDFSKVLGDEKLMQELIDKAQHISSDQKANILGHNAEIAQWHAAHPDAPLTTEQVDQIIAHHGTNAPMGAEHTAATEAAQPQTEAVTNPQEQQVLDALNQHHSQQIPTERFKEYSPLSGGESVSSETLPGVNPQWLQGYYNAYNMPMEDLMHSNPVNMTVNHTLDFVFKNDGGHSVVGSESASWQDFRGRTVDEIAAQHKAFVNAPHPFKPTHGPGEYMADSKTGMESPAATEKMEAVINTISKVTHVAPNPGETVEHFLHRASAVEQLEIMRNILIQQASPHMQGGMAAVEQVLRAGEHPGGAGAAILHDLPAQPVQPEAPVAPEQAYTGGAPHEAPPVYEAPQPVHPPVVPEHPPQGVGGGHRMPPVEVAPPRTVTHELLYSGKVNAEVNKTADDLFRRIGVRGSNTTDWHDLRNQTLGRIMRTHGGYRQETTQVDGGLSVGHHKPRFGLRIKLPIGDNKPWKSGIHNITAVEKAQGYIRSHAEEAGIEPDPHETLEHFMRRVRAAEDFGAR